MNAEHVNAFLVPSVQVLRKMGRMDVRAGRATRRTEESWVEDSMSIIIGLQGRLSGSIVLTATRRVAWSLASRIVGAELAEEDEGEVRAILAEVANTVVGNATGHLYEIGIQGGITPPTVVMGPDVGFDFGEGLETIQVPLETDAGRVEVIVSLAKEAP